MPTPQEESNLAAARRYIELIERFAPPEEFEGVLHPNIQHEEYPNLLMKNGSKRDYATMVVGPQQGRKILRDNHYEIKNAFASGDWVTLEMVWTGTLAIALGGMPEGAELKAHIATILKFQDGQIIAQHQYDCYEPLPVAQ
jgi:ketosteroid isomerase-like protein